jgi:TonB-dependent SusC/RagA subfamily outer membrane receptor
LLVKFTNIEKLHFSVYKVSETQKNQFEESNDDSVKFALIHQFKNEQSWDIILPDLGDYQEHSTEAILPPLPGGGYLIVATVPGLKGVYGHTFIQVTDLALVVNFMDNTQRFQVLRRMNGAPVEGAIIRLKSSARYSNQKLYDQTFITDKRGFVMVPKDDEHYGNFDAIVISNGDTAIFSNYYLSRNYVKMEEDQEEEEPVFARPFIFTDRSIYRPGQTVFFKGILSKKQGDKISVVAGEYVEVYLYDPNDEEVALLRLKTNEYGSFSGEFKLPATGLTGEYNISAEEDYEEDSKFYDEEIEDFEWNELYFSVEEYKRPTFELDFDPMNELARLLDSVTVSGDAKAFTGAPISGARVTYKVTRAVRYPGWYYWSNAGRYQNSEAREITFGEGMTNHDGSFEIRFKAIPDEQVDKDEWPVFEYQVTADITDINGETRSATTTVKVGYHTMEISVHAPSIIDRSKRDHMLLVETQNLNGQKIDASGNINIYLLQSSGRIFRERPWPAPDIQSIGEEEFIRLFPHDPYLDNNAPQPSENRTLVYSVAFNTAVGDTVLLPVNDQWQDGEYIVEAESKDTFDQPVLAKAKFDVRSDHDSEVGNNVLVFHHTDKPSYKAGEKVNFTIGSASKDVSVTIDIEKDHKIVETQIVHLSEGAHTLSIPVKRADIGGFAIHYHLVNYNGFRSGTQIINVAEPAEALNIETATFRDKLQPGAEETWSFTIKGSKNSGTDAELLASMYDASLDQFKPHSWSFDPKRTTRYYSNNQNNAYNSFREANFSVYNLPFSSYYDDDQQFDRQDWFGFSISNNKYVNQQYLSRLSVIYFDTIRQESKVTISNDDQRKAGFVYGRIVDSEGELLPGVNVIVKGTNRGTITDINGEYTIQVNAGEELVFSSVGYVNASVEVDKSNIVDAQLYEDVTKLEEIVVVGYGVQKKADLTGSIVVVADEETVIEEIVFDMVLEEELAGKIPGVSVIDSEGQSYSMMIRGTSSLDKNLRPLYVVDGVIMDASQITADDLASMSVLKGANATAIYGTQAANGVILITTKSGQKKLDEELAKIQVRKNLQETAFFFPQLTTDRKGNISFSFTTPEALTRWKLMLLAHTKDLVTASKTLQAVTSKDLMVVPNAPRFLRQGDEVVISTRITNLTSENMEGMIGLQLSDPFTGADLNTQFGNEVRNQSFSILARGNSEVSWRIAVPENIGAVQYKIVAKAGEFSDGEQNVLPVLSNRILVTETLPMQVRTGESKTFILEKLEGNSSSTLKHHLLTLEVTSNPTWYALQALPYLMEFPYECAEQTFARYYANALAMHIVNQNGDIKKVFKEWADGDVLRSSLETNEDLKSMIIQETPWLRDAQNEAEQKKRISQLFDDRIVKESLESAIYKLEQMQLGNGGFPWFAGSARPDRYITQHIVTGLAHLKHLGVDFESFKADYILKNGLKYLDLEMLDDYNNLLSRADEQYSTESAKQEYLKKNHLSPIQIQYLYVQSYFPDSIIAEKTRPAFEFYSEQASVYWQDFDIYMKGMIALAQTRFGNVGVAKDIIKSLKENSITSEEMGTYWKENEESWHWYHAPIETQSLMIEAISEIESYDTTLSEKEKIETIDNLKIWLLKNKQTNRWSTTKSTTEAIYALLLKGSDWLSVQEQVEISIGDQKIEPQNLPEVATGYFKTSWSAEEIEPDMSEVKMIKKNEGVSWGGLYWQYFEDMDKITGAETSLSLSKSVFVVTNSPSGELLKAVNDTTKLHVGDLVRVRIELKVDRSMDYLHMKDMRASGLEPINVLSGYKWQDGLGYYESTRDASTNFFFDHLPKGVFVFEYDLRVNNSGHFSNGITTIQSMYAPEYSSHSQGMKMVVE